MAKPNVWGLIESTLLDLPKAGRDLEPKSKPDKPLRTEDAILEPAPGSETGST